MLRRCFLLYMYKSSKTVHTTSAKAGQGSFPPAEKPADCASCTENAAIDKTEKIKKYLPVIISSEKSYPLFMIRCLHLLRSTFRPFTGPVDKYSEKPEKLLVF